MILPLLFCSYDAHAFISLLSCNCTNRLTEMSELANVSSGPRARKKKVIETAEFTKISESIIERDFFPDLYSKRSEVMDLTGNVRLDTLNDETVSTKTDKLLRNVNQAKESRHERFQGASSATNPLMFNHPGLADFIPSRRPRVNYANTRFPTAVPQGETGGKSKKEVHAPPAFNFSAPAKPVQGDILQRLVKRPKL